MKSNQPLVSVILPTYNRGYTLARAVNSVLAQTYPHFELIVIDDGSTDDTQAVLAKYRDSRLIVLEPGRNAGAGAARNRGLKVATGDFIAFQDSDDEWLLEKLELQLAHLQAHPEASVSVGGSLCVPVEMHAVGYRGADVLIRDDDFLTLFRYGNTFSTPAWLIRRSKLEQVGYFDETMVTWEDWELSIRLDAVGGFIALEQPLHIAFDTHGSVKVNKNAYAATLEMVMKKHAQWLTTSRRVLAKHYWLMATWERASGRPLSARRYFFKSIATDPTFLRPWLTMTRRFHELFLWPSREADPPSAIRA